MEYTCGYSSPIGEMTMASDGIHLTGLWFDGQKYFGSTLDKEREELPEHRAGEDIPVFGQTKKWLDAYFRGGAPYVPASSCPQGLRFPTAGVGAPPCNPLRGDEDIRRSGEGPVRGEDRHVRTGCGRSCGT